VKVAIDATKLGDYGIGTYVFELVNAAAPLRPDWQFRLLTDGSATPLTAHANVSAFGCGAAGYGPRAIRALSSQARQAGAAVFHAPHYVVPAGLDIPLVTTIHDCIHLRYADQLPRAGGLLPVSVSRWYAATLLRRAARVSDRLIAVSEATRDDLVDLLETPAARIDVVPNGVSTFWSEDPGSDVRAPRPRIRWTGNPKPHKGLDLLLEALTELVGRGNDVELVLAGSPELESFVATHPHRDRIELHGRLDPEDLRRLYTGASLYCLPSRFEGFGLPALEAFATGTPVVAAACGAVRETVGTAGVLVPPDSAEALANGIERVLRDEALAADLTDRGRARARSFTWQRCAEATLRVYEAAAQP
jgi:glycosyltransferase involved in cell wall biosynthesis